MRQMLVMANWKMNGAQEANRVLIGALRDELGGALGARDVACVICPPHPYLSQVFGLLGGTGIALGAQDCGHAASGAYTGEVAADMLADCGCSYVLVGHSERRQYHQESDALLTAKLEAAARSGLTPVLCVGETQEQREAGQADAVVAAQLRGTLGDMPDLTRLVIAYEPVWAIGTGLTATPQEAQEMHVQVRQTLGELDPGSAQKVQILYGGSVKADNAAELFAQNDIDGALVGGASLDAAAFAAIVEAAAKHTAA
ncbi:MAG: triose-phosphate isomerase [Halieaceae bacterium]|jgi:triosephosphate isomerase|nr:triose-phosphate isomerase [Halieaceae bacterium]